MTTTWVSQAAAYNRSSPGSAGRRHSECGMGNWELQAVCVLSDLRCTGYVDGSYTEVGGDGPSLG
eukprot:357516-Chlamydomonas_euryale.AAC.14